MGILCAFSLYKSSYCGRKTVKSWVTRTYFWLQHIVKWPYFFVSQEMLRFLKLYTRKSQKSPKDKRRSWFKKCTPIHIQWNHNLIWMSLVGRLFFFKEELIYLPHLVFALTLNTYIFGFFFFTWILFHGQRYLMFWCYTVLILVCTLAFSISSFSIYNYM